MPTYDYVCQDCSHAFEHFQSMSSDPLTTCPQCQGDLKRLIGTGGALIFKGSGFYCTDYKKPSPDAKVEKAKEASKAVKESSGGESSSSGSESKTSSSTSAA
ncbi:MAG: zinc ribbon domain-containing protein [Planctomycetes bacterium]|nr:zinc ribbon domain-containing protein [Planctomycetota bacterium]